MRLLYRFHRILKQAQTHISTFPARPSGMLVRKYMIFRVRHQPEHVAFSIPDPGNIAHRPIRVIWRHSTGRLLVGARVNQCHLACRFQYTQLGFIGQ